MHAVIDERKAVVVSLDGGGVLKFLPIPAGRFSMGQRGGNVDEEPVTEVEVPEFWMGETPVTQGQYRAMARECLGDLEQIEGNRGAEPSEFKGDDRPVEHVSWDEARLVASWLTEKMAGDGLLPDGCVVDLPSEAQWEYACRAGTETEYWSGDGEAALAEVGWYGGNAGGQTHRVGEKEQPNPWGLHDMHGNVWEWCLDLFEAVRGRFRVPTGGAAAFVDKGSLMRPPVDPNHVERAALFTQIAGGEMELSSKDIPEMVKLRDLAKNIVTNGDSSWEVVLKGSEAALAEGAWPQDQISVAEQLRAIYQERVDSSSDAAEPDRVLRGGSWGNSARDCRSAIRIWNRPGNRVRNYGFRLAVVPGPSS